MPCRTGHGARTMPPTSRPSKSHTTRRSCTGYVSAVEDRLCRTVYAHATTCHLRTAVSPSEGGDGACLELARVLHYALREHTALVKRAYRGRKWMTQKMLRGVGMLLVVFVALQLMPVTRGNPPVVSDISTT